MLAFIPGRAEGGAFVQMVSPEGSRQFRAPGLTVQDGVIRAGKCRFSRRGCQIDLPGVKGELSYGPFTPLESDIMGPFRFFPMECRHGVISMGHTVTGSVSVDGKRHRFDGGVGYVEKDSGVSFPSSYLWVQCNTFSEPRSIMVSVARIPFCGMRFWGCICAVVYEGRHYRLATYKGVRLKTLTPARVCLVQGELRLELDMEPSHAGHPLASPEGGRMSGVIRESANTYLRARLWEGERLRFDLHSGYAAYEYVPER